MILPQTLVGDLSQLESLPEDSIVRQATIVDALFKAAIPIRRYIHHLEDIQKAVAEIAKHA